MPCFACFVSLFASGFGAVAVVVATFVFLLIAGCFWVVEVSLLVLGFAEEDPGAADTFVAPVADLISTGSVWQPTDTTCFATTLANDGCLFTPSTIFLASEKEIFCSVPTRWIFRRHFLKLISQKMSGGYAPVPPSRSLCCARLTILEESDVLSWTYPGEYCIALLLFPYLEDC